MKDQPYALYHLCKKSLINKRFKVQYKRQLAFLYLNVPKKAI